MSSSTENFCSTSVVQQEEGASLIPFGAGYAAPPPTPLASSCHPPADPGFLLAPAPLQSKPSSDNDAQFLIPSTSSLNTASPPSKQDLDALAQYLLQQSLHSTPNLLASPTLQLKRRTSSTRVAAVVHPNKEQEDHAVNSRNNMKFEKEVQTFTYAGGFCLESRRGIGKACQEVGAFYILVQDAEEALLMLKGRHGADDESTVQGGLITLSQLLTSSSQCHQHDVLDIDSFTFDSGIDTTTRDTMTRFASLLSRISKDILRFLLEDLPIETQENIRGHFLKPLLHIHGNCKQELNFEDDVALFISHDIDIRKSKTSVLFLARLGPQLQTWSQGRYKAPLSKSLCDNGSGEICIQFALIQHN